MERLANDSWITHLNVTGCFTNICQKHALLKFTVWTLIYVPRPKKNNEPYWRELWSHVVCPQSWRAKQRTFKLAHDVKTLVGPSPEQADHYTTLVTPAACIHPLQCFAKGQTLLRRALVSFPGKAGTQVSHYVWFNWALNAEHHVLSICCSPAG